MGITKKEIIEKLRGERFKALNEQSELEKKLMENNAKEFLAWIEISKYLDELKDIEDTIITEDIEAKLDPELQVNFETFIQDVSLDGFRESFYSMFSEYLDDQLLKAYDNFLSKKGLMAEFLEMRDNLDLEEERIKRRFRSEFEKWSKNNPEVRPGEKYVAFHTLKKKIENAAYEKLDRMTKNYINSFPSNSPKEAMESLKMAESLIDLICEYIVNKTNNRLIDITKQYKTASKILYKNIIKLQKEENY